MKAITAECLSAEVEHEGRRWMLVLVKTYYATEGSCLVEVLNELGTDSEAVEPGGQWRINRTDDGPTALSVDINTVALEDLADDPSAAINALLHALDYDHWGADVVEEF